MSDVLRTLAHGCSSTALALSMHTHQVLIPVWRWRHDRAPVEGFLRRLASEELILASSGGSDWLVGSGRAEKVEGGYRVTGRKIFASGSPAADLFSTMAVHDDPAEGPTVVHFMIPFDAPGVTLHDNWRTLGMRGTGSNDVTLDGVFVPDAAFFRGAGLERLFRDVQGARYHALRGAAQRRYAGRLALGLDVND